MRIDSEAVARYYREMQVITLPQYARIAFLHETMYNTVRRILAGEEKNVRKQLDTVQNILVQLTAITKTDNDDDDDETSDELLLLYDYLYVKLEYENKESLKDALEILKTLYETFDKLMKDMR